VGATSTRRQALDLGPEPRTRLEAALQLVEREIRQTERGVQRRGWDYLERVEALRGALDERIQTRVTGSGPEPYEVSIRIEVEDEDARGAFAVCTCPYSGESEPCKHGWAALAALGEQLESTLAERSSGEGPPLRRAPWRSALAALDAVLEAGEAPGDPSTRVAWRVAVERGRLTGLEPVEQRREGLHWSAGRRLGLFRLHHDPELARRPDVAPALPYVREEVHVAPRSGYRNARFTVEPGRALLALAGRAALFWADAPEEPVDVRRAEAGLRIRETAGGGLELVPTFGGLAVERAGPRRADDAEDAVMVVVDRPGGAVAVGAVAPAAEAVLDALGWRATPVPPAGRSELVARLPAVAARLPVELPPELEGEPAPADPRPRLLLSPTEGGLWAAIRVRPGAGQPPILPGEPSAATPASFAGGLRVPLRRDPGEERRRARVLVAALQLAEPGPAWRWELAGEAALDLLARLGGEGAPPAGAAVEWPAGGALEASPRAATPADLRVRLGAREDWLGLEGTIDVDGWAVPLGVVLGRLRPDRRWVEVGPGRWLRLSAELRARLARLRDATHPRSGERLEVARAAAPLVDEALAGADVEVEPAWEDQRRCLARARRASPRPPRGLRAELRDYQREGVAWLKRLSAWGVGACLADDMGLGKTVQAIALLLARRRAGPALVVAPTSVGANWRREVERFAPSLRPRLWRDGPRTPAAAAALRGGDVVIASYDLARIDQTTLGGVAWGTLVLDEAQRVKNANSKTARALRALPADWRLALTGTPLENHLGELWSLLRFLAPGLLGSWAAFRERFALPIERDGDDERREALARLVRPLVLRRTKQEVLADLPARTEAVVEVDLGPRQRALYDEARLEALAELSADEEPGAGAGGVHVFAALTRLRQLACHPGLVEPGWRGGSAKLEALLELTDELREGGHRALVFSQFTGHLALVRRALEARGARLLELDGSTPARERQRRVDAFQAGEGELFLISLKAGGTGLNLTGADYVVHLDPWWNPAVEDQATDRAHRIGQERPVHVYRLVARDTIEERILALHARKRDLVAGVLAGTGKAARLSTDELLALIRG